MQATRLNGYSSILYLILLICLQFRDNDFARGDVSREFSHAQEKISDFSVIFVR